jgi:hypothetical protein
MGHKNNQAGHTNAGFSDMAEVDLLFWILLVALVATLAASLSLLR